MEPGFATSGSVVGVLVILPAKTREEVPEDYPASPIRLKPMAYMDAIASLAPATTGIPLARPVSAAASSVIVPMISLICRGFERSWFKSAQITRLISSDHCKLVISRH